jgi:hypothetical protein
MTVGAEAHEWYGDPVRVPLEDLARGLGPYRGKAVRTQGTVGPLGMSSYFYRLSEGSAGLLLMPAEEGLPEGMDKLNGRRVEVVGVVRELPDQQGTCMLGNVQVPETKCADPLLPPLPDRRGHPGWPHNALTWWYITDLAPDEREEGTRMSALEDLVLGSGEPDDQTIEVVGQFRGANLFGDLPDGSQRRASDFVIRHGEAAAWVTGKKPKGKGWALDPSSRGDCKWWLQVKGRAERRNGVVYIRAKKVSMTTRPTAGEP